MRRTATILLAVFAVVSGACTSGEEQDAEARREIEVMLGEYLPVLAEAYTSGNALLLRDWVAEKEIARIHKRIEELADQGRGLEPILKSVTIESVKVWGNANAYVTTVEVWDIRNLVLGTGAVVQEVADQSNRVRYQMKRDEGRWRVLFRTIAE